MPLWSALGDPPTDMQVSTIWSSGYCATWGLQGNHNETAPAQSLYHEWILLRECTALSSQSQEHHPPWCLLCVPHLTLLSSSEAGPTAKRIPSCSWSGWRERRERGGYRCGGEQRSGKLMYGPHYHLNTLVRPAEHRLWKPSLFYISIFTSLHL